MLTAFRRICEHEQLLSVSFFYFFIKHTLNNIAVIGGGFSGLSAACFLAADGQDVTIFEKNESTGGRARSFSEAGFTYDMGPSWYWMPDIFEKFFGSFGKKTGDYYDLVQLDPGFQMIFGKDEVIQIPAKIDDIYSVFEALEKGSADKLKKYLKEGAYMYKTGMNHLVYKPAFSWMEFANYEVLSGAARLQVFKSVSSHVRSYFKDERLVALMEFPVLFLGAEAKRIPALYSLMNYAALSLGTWYPMGGMAEIGKAMETLAKSLGTDIVTDAPITKIVPLDNGKKRLHSGRLNFDVDGVVATGDYHHIEEDLLEKKYRNYNEQYWEKKTFAPSSLIFYLGVSKKIKKLIHHNLFFDASLDKHAKEIYDEPQWPENPLFYACCPSKTDASTAPEGMENLFLLVPIAPGLNDTPEIREHYFEKIMKRMEELCDDSILPYIVFKKSYCVKDFKKDYNAYKGNAYGLANTLMQTAVLKPSLRNKKIKNFYYAGQLTVPGPGVPPALISGQIAAEQLLKSLKTNIHEATI
jgi:phytoene desaturase